MNCKSLYCTRLSLRNKNILFVYYAVYMDYDIFDFKEAVRRDLRRI